MTLTLCQIDYTDANREGTFRVYGLIEADTVEVLVFREDFPDEFEALDFIKIILSTGTIAVAKEAILNLIPYCIDTKLYSAKRALI